MESADEGADFQRKRAPGRLEKDAVAVGLLFQYAAGLIPPNHAAMPKGIVVDFEVLGVCGNPKLPEVPGVGEGPNTLQVSQGNVNIVRLAASLLTCGALSAQRLSGTHLAQSPWEDEQERGWTWACSVSSWGSG